MMEIFMVDVEM